ncbi:MAG: tRNA epoxyqueuosine(34) reductase QueG [Myxococcales bacterium]
MLSAAHLKSFAREAGFHLSGLARAEPLDPEPLRTWLDAGMAASMSWMHARFDERLDPRKLLPGARTVFALACCYLTREHRRDSPIALYAQGRDYHATMLDRLRRLRRAIESQYAGLETFAAVDTSAVMEKVWAAKAGLGWLGKNGLLLTREHGSHVVLATMLLADEVDAYDVPVREACGRCTACLDGCPTRAIVSPGVVDARRCLSFQTIENRELPPDELRGRAANVAFGCDVCQQVCPWTRRDHACDDARFLPREVASLGIDELALLTPERFAELTRGTAVAHARYDGLCRNERPVLGTEWHPCVREIASRLLEDPSPLVREAARWALLQLSE